VIAAMHAGEQNIQATALLNVLRGGTCPPVPHSPALGDNPQEPWTPLGPDRQRSWKHVTTATLEQWLQRPQVAEKLQDLLTARQVMEDGAARSKASDEETEHAEQLCLGIAPRPRQPPQAKPSCSDPPSATCDGSIYAAQPAVVAIIHPNFAAGGDGGRILTLCKDKEQHTAWRRQLQSDSFAPGWSGQSVIQVRSGSGQRTQPPGGPRIANAPPDRTGQCI
jgi:hypothetical protein